MFVNARRHIRIKENPQNIFQFSETRKYCLWLWMARMEMNYNFKKSGPIFLMPFPYVVENC